MKRTFATGIFLLTAILVFALEPHFMKDPAISPDGNQICFVWMDDLWSVPWEGGTAQKLTDTKAKELSPSWSPDGEWIAFRSDRDGRYKLYRIPAGGGQAIKITDEEVGLSDWYPDSDALLTTGKWRRWGSAFLKLGLDGERPTEITLAADEFASLTPDGASIVFNRHGYATREKYTGSMNGDLWRYDIDEDTFTQLTNTPITERYPVVSARGAVYFSRAVEDVFQIFRADDWDFANATRLTSFKQWSARDMSIARQNDRIVYEYFDRLGTYDPATGKTGVLQIEIPQDIATGIPHFQTLRHDMDAYAVSPDGKMVAFTTKYDLFAVPREGGEVRQLTHDQPGIDEMLVMPDNRTIYFTPYRDGAPQLYRLDITKPDVIELVSWSRGRYIESLHPGPDGGILLRFSEGEDYHRYALMDSLGQNFEILTDQTTWEKGVFSPDGKWFFHMGLDFKSFVFSIEAFNRDTKERVTLIRSDDGISDLLLSGDAKSLLYNRGGAIWRLDLVPRDDFYGEEDHWEEILADEKPEEKKNGEDEPEEPDFEIDFNGIADRQVKIISGDGRYEPLSTIDDSTFYYLTRDRDDWVLRQNNLRGKDEKTLYTFPERPSGILWQEELKGFTYFVNDKLFTLNPRNGKPKQIQYETDYQFDESTLDRMVFERVWRVFGMDFYDKDMHGVDWDALKRKYEPYLQYVHTPDMLATIVDEMIGEVNASHTGFYPRSSGGVTYRSRIGIGAEFDFTRRLSRGIRFSNVYRTSSLYLTHGVRPGDLLLAVDGVAIDEDTAIDALFLDKTDRRIKLLVEQDGEEKEIEVRGLNGRESWRMSYHEWVAQREDLVEQWSDGRIGYVHIQGMDWPSYEKFVDDLFARMFEKEALIIDVRYNGGGWTHDQLLETLTKKAYAFTTNRSWGGMPFKTPRQTWEKPSVLLINQNSFSDAEIFPAMYQYLGLGKVIGTPTSGGVIGTGHVYFKDGSSMRMPSNGWFMLDGRNLEGSGAAPDIRIDMTPGDIARDNDVQLKRAVEELLKDL